MFPHVWISGCSVDAAARQKYREVQLEYLKSVRDGLETRLAGVNAAIATVEQQQSRAAGETV